MEAIDDNDHLPIAVQAAHKIRDALMHDSKTGLNNYGAFID
jgi:Tfp pilus assembly protein PilF